MISLTPRLKAVAEYVRRMSVVADIGTDHAYVPAYLIENGIIEKAIASDINEGPLENALKTIEQEHISGIELHCTAGLSGLSECGADDIIIAGMGGEQISNILNDADWCKSDKYNFILQPMTREEQLRRFLYSNGFGIKDETLVKEKDKMYTVINASYTAKTDSVSAPFALLGYSRCGEMFEEKKAAEIFRLKKIRAGLKNKGSAEKELCKIEELIDEIRRY